MMIEVLRMFHLQLRHRLALATMLVSGLTMVIFTVGSYRALEAGLLRAVDERLAVAAHAPSNWNSRTAVPGIVAQRITPDGQPQPLFTDGSHQANLQASSLAAEARAGRTARATVEARPGEFMRLLAIPAGAEHPAGTALVVGESLHGMYRILSAARTVLVAAGILIPLLVTLGVGMAMRSALKAINTLTQSTAGIVATENYGQGVVLPAQRDEIYYLSATINDLIGAVQRTLEQKRQFLAFTSHELRSPLTVILANLDLLRRDLTPDERALSIVEATEEARRMRRLVNDLLLLAEKDSTRMVARTPMRLDSLIEETVAVTIPQDQTHTVHVDVESPVVVEGDAERLMQAVRNLVENALMHTPPGTQIEVRLTQSQGYAHIVVADNGPGIAPEHLPYLWERFYRVDRARSRVKDSTGLGLPIVKYVAEAHDGSVELHSTPGHGTVFTVNLPLARNEGSSVAAHHASSSRST